MKLFEVANLINRRLVDMSEAEWTAQAIGSKSKPGIARQLGFRCYHTLRSKGSEAGFPDWTLFRERTLFLELKTERGKLSEAQKGFLRDMLAAKAEVYVVRPHDFERLGAVLSFRANPLDPTVIPYTGAGDRARAAATELDRELREELDL